MVSRSAKYCHQCFRYRCYSLLPTVDDATWLQVWLQEFAWTEAEKLRRLKDRSSNLRLTSIVREEVDREPMFCFETAIKLYYFSHIIYFYDKVCASALLSCRIFLLKLVLSAHLQHASKHACMLISIDEVIEGTRLGRG